MTAASSARSICLEQVHLVPSARDEPIVCNVYIEDGVVKEIDRSGRAAAPTDDRIDCSHHVAIPGLANMHLHCRPGRALNDGMPVPIWHKAVDRIAAMMTHEDSYVGAQMAYGEMLLGGITSALVMTRFFEHAARAGEDLGVRTAVAPLAGDGGGAHAHALDDLPSALATIRDQGRQPGSRVQLWPGFDSPMSTSIEGMETVARVAGDLGLGLHAHMAETRFEYDRFLEVDGRTEAAALEEAGVLRPGAVIAHCNWLDDEDFARFLRTGAAIVHNPTSNMKFASGICEAKALREAGVHVALGTDGMLSNFHLDMFEVMRAAASLQRIHTGDPMALTPADVLEMATVKGASLLGSNVGVVAEGWAADITVLDMSALHLQPYRRGPLNDPDLLNLLVWCGRAADVVHVVCDGQLVVRDRRLTFASKEEIAERVRAVDARMRPGIKAEDAAPHH